MRKLIFCFLAVPCSVFAQKELTVTVVPPDADIYNVSLSVPVKIGTGSVTLKLEKEKPVLLEARKDGYVSVQKTFLRKKDGDPNDVLELTDRVVQINASPADASIFIGGYERGKTPQTAIIKKGESVTVDIKKSGFVPLSKTYYNNTGHDVPEVSGFFKLEDRVVSVKTQPQDASIFVEDKKKGDGSAQIIIPKDKCVTVRVEKTGYMHNEVTYCNKESETVPPLNEEIKLKDRKIQINVMPEDAKIFIDGKEVAKGSYSVKVPAGKCSQVLVVKPSFVTERYELCNQPDAPQPEPSYAIKMKEDEAYQQSEESSIANKNFTIIIDNPAITPTDAWKKLNSIIQSRFEEIEVVDQASSYIKTNWVGKAFNKGSEFVSMIRTRVIVTGGGSTNTYNVKIQSEMSKPDSDCGRAGSNESGKSRLTPTMDECFEPVDRILRKYSDLISEIQRRFK